MSQLNHHPDCMSESLALDSGRDRKPMHMYPNTLVAPLDLDDRKMHLKKNSIRSCAEDKRSPSSTMLIGFDWGTNKSCLKASPVSSNEIVLSEIVPTVVGYAHDGIV